MMRRIALLALAAEVSAQTAETYHCLATGFTDLDACFPNADDVTVATTNGSVIGKLGPDGIARFYGVEFANSTGTGPDGPRFKYPKPLGTWDEAKPAKVIKDCATSEDCLQLHIATPATFVNGVVTSTRIPVHVYFTGGGFMNVGNPAGPLMDAAYHARYGSYDGKGSPEGKAVMVYCNYRLAMFGFMAHEGFGRGNGNFGLADGIEGLKWVQANIGSFGGNPNMVTIQGSSAGGGFVSLLLASPLSVGLIHNVFSMSPYVSYHPAFYSMTMRKEIGMMYMVGSGCAEDFNQPTGADAANQFACLEAQPIEALFPQYATDGQAMTRAVGFGQNTTDSSTGVPVTDTGTMFVASVKDDFDAFYSAPFLATFLTVNFGVAPVVDDYVLTKPPLELYREGLNNAVTVVMGHQVNEYSSMFSIPGSLTMLAPMNTGYQIGIKDLPVTATATEIFLAAAVAPALTDIANQAYPGFGSTNSTLPSGWHTNIQIATDVFFTWGIKSATDAMKAGGYQRTYKLLNTMGAPASAGDALGAYLGDFGFTMGAYHAAEDNLNMGHSLWEDSFLSEAFGMFAGIPYTAEEIAAARAMTTHFKNIMMGNPPDLTGVSWPANSDTQMVYGTMFGAGAAFGPCIRVHASAAGCVTEKTDTYRASQLAYFENPTTFVPGAYPAPSASCDVPYLEADGGASGPVSGSFGLTMTMDANSASYSCSECTCSSRRNVLFGVPSVPGSLCSCA